MTQRIYFIMAMFAILIVFVSNSTGPAIAGWGIRNGSPSKIYGTCGDPGCHAGGTGNTTINVQLFDQNLNQEVNYYVPNKKYQIVLTGDNNNLPKFGFQITAMDTNNRQAGTFDISSTLIHQQYMTGDSIWVVEHTQPLAKDLGKYRSEFNWTAPSTIVGRVNFYAMINAVNGDYNITGDCPSPPFKKVVFDNINSSASNTIFAGEKRIFPNPCKDYFIFDSGMDNIDYSMHLFTIFGDIIVCKNSKKGSQLRIDTSHLPSGMYVLQISNGMNVANYIIVKN